jgi:uncharacterized protein (DUF433 family)
MSTNTCVAERPRTDVALNPRLFSLREAMVLAGVPEKEKEVRNDISRGLLPSASVVRFDTARLCFHLPYVPAFAAIYGNELLDGGEFRRVAFEKVLGFATSGFGTYGVPAANFHVLSVTADCWATALEPCSRSASVHIDHYLTIDFGKVCEDVKPRIRTYVNGLKRVEERDSILGGAAVFQGTRISVAHVGMMAERGVFPEHIIEDYPALSEGDIAFARLYFRARPPVGRPKKKGVSSHAESPSG